MRTGHSGFPVDVHGCFPLKPARFGDEACFVDLQSHRVPLTLPVPALAQLSVHWVLLSGCDGTDCAEGRAGIGQGGWLYPKKKVREKILCDESGETLT